MTKLIIDTEDTTKLAERGGQLVFKREAEEAILELRKMISHLEEILEHVKKSIADAGEQVNPNFKGVIGEQIRAVYRVFGEKYTYNKDLRDVLFNNGYLKKTEAYKVDSKMVDEYFQKKAVLPEGIEVKERQKVISFVESKHEKDETLLQSSIAVDDGKE